MSSDNHLRFGQNLLKQVYNKNMTNDQIEDGKPQCDINTEASKISALQSGKIVK